MPFENTYGINSINRDKEALKEIAKIIYFKYDKKTQMLNKIEGILVANGYLDNP